MSLLIPEVADAVAADFAARGIDAEVFYGDWTESLAVGNSVTIGVASEFQDADLGPANTPGLQDLGDGAEAARTLFTMVEIANVWVYHTPVGDEKDPNRLKETFKACRRLVAATIAAMHRACPGVFGWGSGQFAQPEKSEFRFGALATFKAQFLTPVLDDAYPLVEVAGYSGEIYATMPHDGDVLVATVTKETS